MVLLEVSNMCLQSKSRVIHGKRLVAWPGLGWCFVLWTVGMVLTNKLEIIRQQRVQRAVAALLERAIVSIHWLVEVRACISNMYSR